DFFAGEHEQHTSALLARHAGVRQHAPQRPAARRPETVETIAGPRTADAERQGEAARVELDLDTRARRRPAGGRVDERREDRAAVAELERAGHFETPRRPRRVALELACTFER